MSFKRRVGYIYSEEFVQAFKKLEKFFKRSILVHELISAYGLLDELTQINPVKCEGKDLLSFHSEQYISFIKNYDEVFEDNEIPDEADEFGLAYDCPVFLGLFNTVQFLAGGSLTAARSLVNKAFDIVLNWGGGWHHCKKDEAAGFCYVNDIVLAILELKKEFSKVLYVDFDIHHGDGVEEAFEYTSSVLCLSIHKFGYGFYPGTGSLNSNGRGKGQYYTINVPFKDGIRDEPYRQLVCKLLEDINTVYKPDCVVAQCGADCLSGDPMGVFNLTLGGLGSCLQTILAWEKPLLVLGGGGYSPPNTARCWTYLTSLVCQRELSNDIPYHEEFLNYGPEYELNIIPGNRSDLNDNNYLETITTQIKENLKHIT